MSKSLLSKWDENWLAEEEENKWGYVSEYIQNHWPPSIGQYVKSNFYPSNNEFARDAFNSLLQNSPNDARYIIRKTKEAWRSHKQSALRKKSGNYTHVKLTSSNKKKMRKLAGEVGLSSVNDVISHILTNEYNELLANKKAEREAKAVEVKNRAKVYKKATLVDVFSNSKLNEMNRLNKKLEKALEVAHQNLALLSEVWSEQQVLLERYSGETMEALTEEEIKQVGELADIMTDSLKRGTVFKSAAK